MGQTELIHSTNRALYELYGSRIDSDKVDDYGDCKGGGFRMVSNGSFEGEALVLC
jgi:hypothetical protein